MRLRSSPAAVMARTISRTSLTDDAGISTGVPDTRAGAAADVDKIGRAMPLATPPASRMLTATTPAPMLRSHAIEGEVPKPSCRRLPSLREESCVAGSADEVFLPTRASDDDPIAVEEGSHSPVREVPARKKHLAQRLRRDAVSEKVRRAVVGPGYRDVDLHESPAAEATMEEVGHGPAAAG